LLIVLKLLRKIILYSPSVSLLLSITSQDNLPSFTCTSISSFILTSFTDFITVSSVARYAKEKPLLIVARGLSKINLSNADVNLFEIGRASCRESRIKVGG